MALLPEIALVPGDVCTAALGKSESGKVTCKRVALLALFAGEKDKQDDKYKCCLCVAGRNASCALKIEAQHQCRVSASSQQELHHLLELTFVLLLHSLLVPLTSQSFCHKSS